MPEPDSVLGYRAALLILAYFPANLAYFSVIFVSICATRKLARSILMRDRNTATDPDFRHSFIHSFIYSFIHSSTIHPFIQ